MADPTPEPLTALEDQRTRLEALRDQLASALQVCSENMLPQLSGQYRATLADLAALPPAIPPAKTKLDELRERRESNLTQGRSAETPTVGATPAKGRQRRA